MRAVSVLRKEHILLIAKIWTLLIPVGLPNPCGSHGRCGMLQWRYSSQIPGLPIDIIGVGSIYLYMWIQDFRKREEGTLNGFYSSVLPTKEGGPRPQVFEIFLPSFSKLNVQKGQTPPPPTSLKSKSSMVLHSCAVISGSVLCGNHCQLYCTVGKLGGNLLLDVRNLIVRVRVTWIHCTYYVTMQYIIVDVCPF